MTTSEQQEHNNITRSQAPSIPNSKKIKKGHIISFFLIGCLLGFIGWFIPFLPLLWMDGFTITRYNLKREKVQVEVGPKAYSWVPLKRISKHMIHATIAAEDSSFFKHSGVDWSAMVKSFEVNSSKGKYVRGGSTITQQLIKNAFLTREKTIIRKSRELVGAVLLEWFMPKERILEWYLNIIEFGGGIYGIKAASVFYFRTQPDLLTIEQSIQLATVIPSPGKWSFGLKKKNLTPFGQKRFLDIAMEMYRSNYITAQQKEKALANGNFGMPIPGREQPTEKQATEQVTGELPRPTENLPEPSATPSLIMNTPAPTNG